MVAEVVVGAAVDAFELLEAEGEVEFYVGRRVGVVGELLMVVETVVLRAHAEVHVPLHAVLLPLAEPFHLGAGPYEELHLHLLELPHAEDELAGHHLVAEGLADLGYAEGNLHASGLLDVDVVHEYALCGLGAQIDLAAVVANGAELGGEHQVELTHVGPVPGAADGADYAAVEDYLLVLGEVVRLLCGNVAVVNLFVMGLVAQHVGVGLAELLLVEAVAELAASLLHLLVDLLLDLGEVVLDEHVGAVSFLGVLVVDEGVVECGYVS